MNIFQTYLDKIIQLLKTAKENNLLELPENLSGINVEIPPAKFNYDMSEPLIETSRDYSLVYILSTIVIFLIFSIFLSILLDSRK